MRISENVVFVIVMIIIVSIMFFTIYLEYQKNSQYKYKISYNCDWNGCLFEYTDNYKIEGNCLVTDKNIICGEYSIKKLKGLKND